MRQLAGGMDAIAKEAVDAQATLATNTRREIGKVCMASPRVETRNCESQMKSGAARHGKGRGRGNSFRRARLMSIRADRLGARHRFVAA
jgi:hypothetical protein